MKKWGLSLGILVFSTVLLSACGNDSKDTSAAKGSASSSTTVVSSSETVESSSSSSSANQANLEQAAKKLDEMFNSNGEKHVKVEISNDVIDSTSNVAHSDIEVRAINDDERKSLEETQDAINSNSATDDQKTIIYGIQVNIEEVAKTLDNENDTITFIVPMMNGSRMAIAQATKTENIIPLVM